MPPMLPICMSTMSRSGDSSATNATTSGPEVTARTSMSGPLMTASTSLRSVGASLATRMVCTEGTLSDRPEGPETRSCPAGWAVDARHGRPASGGRSGRRGGRPPAQPDELVHVLPEEGDPADRGRRHLRRQAGERRPPRAASALSSARLASRAASSGRGVAGAAAVVPVAEGRRDPVHHERGDRDVPLGQLLGEVAGLGDGVGPGRGDEDVGRGGSARSSCTALARLRKPSSIPSKAWKKLTASCTISAPATLAIVRSRAWVATPTARSDTGRHQEGPEESVLEEAGEPARRRRAGRARCVWEACRRPRCRTRPEWTSS